MLRFIYYYSDCHYAECRGAVIYDQTIFLQLSLKEADTNKPFTDLLTQNTNLMKPKFCLMLKYNLG
jgi:hypothetical protein